MFSFPVTFFGGSGPRFVFNGIAAAQVTNSTFTFTSQALSDAAADRFIVTVVEIFTSGTNFAINSLTVAGISASSIVDRQDSGGTQKVHTAMWGAAVPTGTSGSIVVNLAGSISRIRVANYALYNLSSTTAAHTANNGGGSGNTSVSVSIDVPATGILLASAAYVNSTNTQTLSATGLTVDANVTDSSIINFQMGSHQATTAETGTTVTYSGTAAAGSARSLVAASWS